MSLFLPSLFRKNNQWIIPFSLQIKIRVVVLSFHAGRHAYVHIRQVPKGPAINAICTTQAYALCRLREQHLLLPAPARSIPPVCMLRLHPCIHPSLHLHQGFRKRTALLQACIRIDRLLRLMRWDEPSPARPPWIEAARHCIGNCDRSNSDDPAGCCCMHVAFRGSHSWYLIDSRKDRLQCSAMWWPFLHRINVRHTHICTTTTVITLRKQRINSCYVRLLACMQIRQSLALQ